MRSRRCRRVALLGAVGFLSVLVLLSHLRPGPSLQPPASPPEHVHFENVTPVRWDPADTTVRRPSLVVHFDFKGSPPRPEFLRSVLDLIAQEGVNGVLFEYEDMFPYEGSLANLSARNAYSKEQVQQMVSWAEERGLQVIPLVQTFGHLEFTLKLQDFRHLRELDSDPRGLCPSNPGSLTLVAEMVRQVAALHPHSRFLHLGGDEVPHLGECRKCIAQRLSRLALYAQHMRRVAQHVRTHHPTLTPLIWDDMMRSANFYELRDTGLGELVELVVWEYGNQIFRLIPNRVWYQYGRVFGEDRIWGAGAFRGADGVVAWAPTIDARLANFEAWRRRRAGAEGEPRPKPAAVILTGWARYDHFAALAEPLPAAVPALVLGFLALRARGDDIGEKLLQRWREKLRCPSDARWVPLVADQYQWELRHCAFPGADAFAAIAQCHSAVAAVEGSQFSSNVQGWLTEHNIRRNFTSLAHTNQQLADDLRRRLRACRTAAAAALASTSDAHTAAEWLEVHVAPAERKVEALIAAAAKLTDRRTWPRRPLD